MKGSGSNLGGNLRDTGLGGRAPRVFVSYAHDTRQHKEQVLAFCTFLRNLGIDVDLDQWNTDARRDWYFWAEKQIEDADFVIVVVSSDYRRAADGNTPPQQNRGIQTEAAILRDRLHGDRATWLPKILPVILPGRAMEEIPTFLQPYSSSRYMVTNFTSEGAEELLRVLTAQPGRLRPLLGSAPNLSISSGDDPSSHSEFPDRSPWVSKANVDHEKNGFFGRDSVTRRLADELVSRTGSWIVTVIGQGGIGKTAVSFEAVRLVSSSGVFGKVLWTKVRGEPWQPRGADMDTISWDDTVVDLANQLGVTLGPSRTLWESELEEGIRNCDGPVLTIVDNLEIDTQTTMIINRLCELGFVRPHKILVTSRALACGPSTMVRSHALTGLTLVDTTAFIRYLGAHDEQFTNEPDSAFHPIFTISGGNPYLIKLIVQRFKSTHQPLTHIIEEIATSGNDVQAHLFDRSLTEFDRRVGNRETRMLMAAFSVRRPGDEVTTDELRELSGLGDDFDHVLAVGCALGLVQGTRLNTRYSIHGLLHEFVARDAPDNATTDTT